MRVFSSPQLISMNANPAISGTMTMVELRELMPGSRVLPVTKLNLPQTDCLHEKNLIAI